MAEDDCYPRPAAEAKLNCRHPTRRFAERQRAFDSEKNQKVGMRAAIELRAVATRDSAAGVRCPAALPKWIEAESGHEISSAFDPMAACAKAGDETRPNVDAARHRESEAAFDAGGSSENSVYPSFDLHSLLGHLAMRDRRRENTKENQSEDRKVGLCHLRSGDARSHAAPPERDGVVDDRRYGDYSDSGDEKVR